MKPHGARMRLVDAAGENGWAEAIAAWRSASPDAALPWPPTLSHVVALFDLDRAEGDLILGAVAAELDPAVPAPSFRKGFQRGLDWAAIAPDQPLRRWRILRPAGSGPLADRPLELDERILHHLMGVGTMDATLARLVSPITADDTASLHAELAERLAEAASAAPAALCGADRQARRAVAAAAAGHLGASLHCLPAGAIPEDAEERDLLAVLWQREARLGRRLLSVEVAAEEEMRRALLFVERLERGVLLCGERAAAGALRSFEVPRLGRDAQAALWQAGGVDPGEAARLAATFDLDQQAIRAALPAADRWLAARRGASAGLDGLIDRIEPVAAWDDLILPAGIEAQVRMVASQALNRATVFGAWGAARDPRRGGGLAALFAGPSGTGKTLAAEVIAKALRLDLARVDLSQLVSKYIGETEKNIARVCDAAEASGAVLLFDEADALFGKRSDVKDAHDRHANLEVSYLLQRIESYRGLAILTTNLADHIDDAFLRRLRFIVNFPAPEMAERARIWARAFPPRAPVEGLEPGRLAQLQVAGGMIREIALTAMFLAAEDGGAVTMARIARAAALEYEKVGRTLHRAETEGWS